MSADFHLVHSEERGISISGSTKIDDFDCGVSCEDSSFVRMTKMIEKICSICHPKDSEQAKQICVRKNYSKSA